MTDLDKLVEHVSILEGTSVTTDPKYWNQDNTEYGVILKLWNDSKFNVNSIKWINYYPEKDFDMSIVDEYCDKLNINLLRSWISRIDPGYYAPYHYDIDDKEQEYLQQGMIERYTIFIDKPKLGHIFILNEEHYYNIEQGTIVKWDNYRDWHIGINGGLSPNYMLHILGINRA